MSGIKKIASEIITVKLLRKFPCVIYPVMPFRKYRQATLGLRYAFPEYSVPEKLMAFQAQKNS